MGVPTFFDGIQDSRAEDNAADRAAGGIQRSDDFLITLLGHIDREGATWMVRAQPVLVKSGAVVDPHDLAQLVHRDWVMAYATNAQTSLPSILYQATEKGQDVLREHGEIGSREIVWLSKIRDQGGLRWTEISLDGIGALRFPFLLRLVGLGLVALCVEDLETKTPVGIFRVTEKGESYL